MAAIRYPALRWKSERKAELQQTFGEVYRDCQSPWSEKCNEFLTRYKAAVRLIEDVRFSAGWVTLELTEYRFRNVMSILKLMVEDDLYEWREAE